MRVPATFVIMLVENILQLTSGDQGIRSREYTKSEIAVSGPGKSRFTQTRSRIGCSAACLRDDDCLSFAFDTTTKVCKVSTEMLTKAGPAAFHKRCPANLGYKLLIYPNMALCLKYNSNRLNHILAVKACEEDSGHLALIDSSTMHSYIPNFISEFNMALDKTMFDGYDWNHNNTYYTWKGELLPWIKWEGVNPTNRPQEDCIQIDLNDGQYYLRDFICHRERPSVCQIEMK